MLKFKLVVSKKETAEDVGKMFIKSGTHTVNISGATYKQLFNVLCVIFNNVNSMSKYAQLRYGKDGLSISLDVAKLGLPKKYAMDPVYIYDADELRATKGTASVEKTKETVQYLNNVMRMIAIYYNITPNELTVSKDTRKKIKNLVL